MKRLWRALSLCDSARPVGKAMSASSSTVSGSSSQDMVGVRSATVAGMQLLQLPDELLDVIVSFIEDVADLRSAASTCSRLNGLAEPFLYQSVVFSDGGQAIKLKTSVERRARRASWVHHLLVSTRFEKAYGIENVPGSLARMHNLQSVHLETPDCNQKKPHERVLWIALQERYERIFQNSSLLMPREQRSLPRLQSCTLHFVDNETELCSLATYSALFLHPMLRLLRISCAYSGPPEEFLPTVQDDPQLKWSTTLEQLHFEECDLLPATLAIVLRFPKALKSLTISEGTRYTVANGFHERRHGDMIPYELSSALCNQGRSLENLSLSLGFGDGQAHQIDDPRFLLDLHEMSVLKHLEVDSSALNLICPKRRSLLNSWKRMPPKLESLKVFALHLAGIPSSLFLRMIDLPRPFSDEAEIMRWERIKQLHPNMRKLEYGFIYAAPFGGLIDDAVLENFPLFVRMTRALSENRTFELDPPGKRAAQELAIELDKKCGLQLGLSISVLPSGYIPPYLHFEEHPAERILFDSEG